MPLPLGYSAVDLNSGAVAHAFPRNARRAIDTTTAKPTDSNASKITRLEIKAVKIIKLPTSSLSCDAIKNKFFCADLNNVQNLVLPFNHQVHHCPVAVLTAH